jgi:glycosyltransferase involved in cell wall biosynthesis
MVRIQRELWIMSKITVITPIYNHGQYILSLYEKMMEQTEKDWEWLIIDDKSSDNTREKIVELPKDERISIIFRKHKGCIDTSNYGLSIAKSLYVTIINADDYPLSSFLETYYNYLINNKKDIVVGGHYSSIGDVLTDESNLKKPTKHRGVGGLSPANMWNNQIVGVNPFEQNHGAYLDLGFWYKILSNGYRLGFIKTPLYVYRKDSSILNKMHNKGELKEFRSIVEQQYSNIKNIEENFEKYWKYEVNGEKQL